MTVDYKEATRYLEIAAEQGTQVLRTSLASWPSTEWGASRTKQLPWAGIARLPCRVLSMPKPIWGWSGSGIDRQDAPDRIACLAFTRCG